MRRNLRIERIWNALIVSLSLEINHCRSQEVETGKEELVWMICGSVISDVLTADKAHLAQDASACAVISLE